MGDECNIMIRELKDHKQRRKEAFAKCMKIHFAKALYVTNLISNKE